MGHNYTSWVIGYAHFRLSHTKQSLMETARCTQGAIREEKIVPIRKNEHKLRWKHVYWVKSTMRIKKSHKSFNRSLYYKNEPFSQDSDDMFYGHKHLKVFRWKFFCNNLLCNIPVLRISIFHIFGWKHSLCLLCKLDNASNISRFILCH